MSTDDDQYVITDPLYALEGLCTFLRGEHPDARRLAAYMLLEALKANEGGAEFLAGLGDPDLDGFLDITSSAGVLMQGNPELGVINAVLAASMRM